MSDDSTTATIKAVKMQCRKVFICQVYFYKYPTLNISVIEIEEQGKSRCLNIPDNDKPLKQTHYKTYLRIGTGKLLFFSLQET